MTRYRSIALCIALELGCFAGAGLAAPGHSMVAGIALYRLSPTATHLVPILSTDPHAIVAAHQSKSWGSTQGSHPEAHPLSRHLGDPSTPSVTVPFITYHRMLTGKHWTTTLPISRDFTYQTTVGYLLRTGGKGRHPLYDCVIAAYNDHYIAASQACDPRFSGSGRLAGFAFDSPPAGIHSVQVFRCYNGGANGSDDHFDTTDPHCNSMPGYSSEGPQGYILADILTSHGPTDWWKADGDAKDSVGSNDGKLSNVAFTKGVSGQAFGFDGTNSSIDFGPRAGNFGRDFTIQFWAKVYGSGEGILGKRPICQHSNFWDIRGGKEGLSLEMDQNGANYFFVSTHHALDDGVFHLITFVRHGTTVSAYSDAHLDASASSPQPTDMDNSADLIAGRSTCTGPEPQGDNTGWLNGQLDEIKFYNRALSKAEIIKKVGNSSPVASVCRTSSFVGQAVKVFPACGKLGDLVTVTVLHPVPLGAKCYISDQVGYSQTFDCSERLSRRFRILLGGGYFEVVVPAFTTDTYYNPPKIIPMPGFQAQADFYCLRGSSFFLRAGAAYDWKQVTDPVQYGPPTASPCPASPTPKRSPLTLRSQRSNCTTPDIQVHPRAIAIKVGSWPHRYSGVVATFCDNNLTTSPHNYTATVLWNASYSPGDEIYPGASLYGNPNTQNQSDIDPSPSISKIRPGEFKVMSTFLMQAPGHIRITVMVHKNEQVDSGGFSARVSTAYITWTGAAASQHAIDNASPSDLLAHMSDPLFTVGYFNSYPYALAFIPHLTNPPSANVMSWDDVFGRAIVSALTSQQASKNFCDNLVYTLTDTHSDYVGWDASVTRIGAYIASNASAADALLDPRCASDNTLSSEANNSAKGATHPRPELLWRIAATAFLDHLDDYANCNPWAFLSRDDPLGALHLYDQTCGRVLSTEYHLTLDPEPQRTSLTLEEYLTKKNAWAEKQQEKLTPYLQRLQIIAALATETLTHETAPPMSTAGMGLPEYSPAANASFLERGIALWILAHVPHPIFCAQNKQSTISSCDQTADYSQNLWTTGMGQIVGSLSVGVLMNNNASQETARAQTDANNLSWGIGFFVLGVVATVATAGASDAVAFGVPTVLGLGTTLASPWIPKVHGDISSYDAGTDWTYDFAGFLIQSHSLWKTFPDGHYLLPHSDKVDLMGVVVPDEGQPFSQQVTAVVESGNPLNSCQPDVVPDPAHAASGQFVLVDQNFSPHNTPTACKGVFQAILAGKTKVTDAYTNRQTQKAGG